jgi:hypothetical protein
MQYCEKSPETTEESAAEPVNVPSIKPFSYIGQPSTVGGVVASLTLLVIQTGRQRQQPVSVDDREVRHPLRARAPGFASRLDALGPARAEITYSGAPKWATQQPLLGIVLVMVAR